MILAQQSVVIEILIRTECGILTFEKMENVGTIDQKVDCIKFMYGAPLELNVKNIETTLKFAHFYGVEDLFNKSLKWIKTNLSPRNIFMFADISKSFESEPHLHKFQAVLDEFIVKNADAAGLELAERLTHGDHIDPSIFMSILKHSPSNGSALLREWVEKSSENKTMILQKSEGLDFLELFPTQPDFTNFIACLSSGSDSVESMKQVLALQQNYFIKSAQRSQQKQAAGAKQQVAQEEADEETESVTSNTKSATGSRSRRGGQFNAVNRPAPVKASERKAEGFKVDSEESKEHRRPNMNKPRTANHPGQLNKLFIGNVPAIATIEDIRKPFVYAGAILNINIVKGKNVAFIEFKTVHSAKQILDKVQGGFKYKVLDGFVHVAPCKPMNKNPSTIV